MRGPYPVDKSFVRNLAAEDIQHLLENQVTPANYRLPPKPAETRPDRIFTSSQDVWKAILDERVRAGMIIILRDCDILEWLPRSPGLYHTPEAAASRAMADNFRVPVVRGGSEVNYALEVNGDFVTVYDPHGKAAMIAGGLGSIRLKPRLLNDELKWFMCATSYRSHEGVPLAIPDMLYQSKVVDDIGDFGCCRAKTIVGKLQIIPDQLVTLYGYKRVPQVYLDVESIERVERQTTYDPAVSVSVLFTSTYEGEEKTYATYVFFNPMRAESFRNNVGWMEETYVHGEYKGRIVTDFDEIVPRFDAPFSLAKVMDFELDRKVMETTLSRLGVNGDTTRLFAGIEEAKLIIGEVHVGDKYDIKGQAAAVGRNARAENINFNQIWNDSRDQIDLTALRDELAKLRQALRDSSESAEHDNAIGEVAAAELAAKEQDGPKALAHLAKAGKWALDVAERIGVAVASAAIKTAIGV